MNAVLPPVDRSSERWLRLRAACQHSAVSVDLDEHTDRVWQTVETFTHSNTTGSGRKPVGGNTAGARRDPS